jgi:hypothetical protein
MQCPPEVRKEYFSDNIIILAVPYKDYVEVSFERPRSLGVPASKHIVPDSTLDNNMGTDRCSQLATLLGKRKGKMSSEDLQYWKENIKVCNLGKTYSSLRIVHAVVISMIEEVDWHNSQGISRLLSTTPNVRDYFVIFLDQLQNNPQSGLHEIAFQVQEDLAPYHFFFENGQIKIFPGVETSRRIHCPGEKGDDSAWSWFVLITLGIIFLLILYFLIRKYRTG